VFDCVWQQIAGEKRGQSVSVIGNRLMEGGRGPILTVFGNSLFERRGQIVSEF